jgi:hypothetical protein
VLPAMPVELQILRFSALCCCKLLALLLHTLSCRAANASRRSYGDATGAMNLAHRCCKSPTTLLQRPSGGAAKAFGRSYKVGRWTLDAIRDHNWHCKRGVIDAAKQCH